MNPTF